MGDNLSKKHKGKNWWKGWTGETEKGIIAGFTVQEKATVCHSGNKLVAKVGNLTLYGGGKSRSAHAIDGGVTLDLADMFTPAVWSEGFALAVPMQRRLVFTWPDGSTPALAKAFWSKLAASLTKVANDENGLEVLVACVGGHGRTGTALAILGHYLGFIEVGDDLVQWIWDHYCVEAVETQSQKRYIEEMTGRKVNVKIPESVSTWIPNAGPVGHVSAWGGVDRGFSAYCGMHSVWDWCHKSSAPIVQTETLTCKDGKKLEIQTFSNPQSYTAYTDSKKYAAENPTASQGTNPALWREDRSWTLGRPIDTTREGWSDDYAG